MAAQRVDLETGLVDPDNGVSIEHEHVTRTLLESVGITEDVADLRVDPIQALLS